jgi:hypothetical protein
MPINHKSIIALMSCAILMILAFTAICAYQQGYFGSLAFKASAERINHSEIRTAFVPR